ncbi:PulJ/GspJ family protein [Sutcliffiella halmapala]
MNLFVKILKDERGISLYELLAVLAISSIIMSSMYGAFIMGINLYKKIGIEAQMRDEADIMVASLLNDLNSIEPDAISVSTQKELSLYTVSPEVYKDYLTIESDLLKIASPSAVPQGKFYIKERAESSGSSIKKYDLFKYQDGEEIRINDGTFFLQPIDDSTPIMTFTCSQNSVQTTTGDTICSSGTINTHFKISHGEYSAPSNRLYVEPMEFHSEFGY